MSMLQFVRIRIKRDVPVFPCFGIRIGQEYDAFEVGVSLRTDLKAYIIPEIGKHGLIIRDNEATVICRYGEKAYRPHYKEIPAIKSDEGYEPQRYCGQATEKGE